jgi:hypothetical protein
MRRNPYGKRLCGRAAALLVAQVERPHFTPRALQPTRKDRFAAMRISEVGSDHTSRLTDRRRSENCRFNQGLAGFHLSLSGELSLITSPCGQGLC